MTFSVQSLSSGAVLQNAAINSPQWEVQTKGAHSVYFHLLIVEEHSRFSPSALKMQAVTGN